MTKSSRALHTAHFLLSDAKHLSAHVWQNLECPPSTKTTSSLCAPTNVTYVICVGGRL